MLTFLVFAQSFAAKSCLFVLRSILFIFSPLVLLSSSLDSSSEVLGQVRWNTSHVLRHHEIILSWFTFLGHYLNSVSFVSSPVSFKTRYLSLIFVSCLIILTAFSPGIGADPGLGDDSDAWDFTYRPRAGDSDREPIDVVEDYLGYFPSPDGANMRDITLFPSGEPEDFMYVNPDRDRETHDPDCSSYEKNIKGTIKPAGGKKKTTLKSENFYDIVTKSEIVHDRTLLMKDLFTRKFKKHIHLTRPEGWGKTVALDMIRRFLGLEVDMNGRPLPEDKKANRVLFEGGSVQIGNTTKILPTLKIGNRNLMLNRFGKYPIIYFSFKNVTGTSFKEVFENLKRELVTLVRSHAHLFPVVKTARFQKWDKMSYLKFFKNKTDQMTVNDVKNCCVTLTRATKHFYKMRPMVIFDDFDMPLRSSYEHIFGNRDEVWAIFDMVDDMFEKLMRNFFDARKMITAGVLPFVRHPHRVFTYMDFHEMIYNLDLYIGIREPSTTQPPSREWTITKTPYYWHPTNKIDI
ncbi:hypothetical protein WDU94_002315 [Cyamophila willieti]